MLYCAFNTCLYTSTQCDREWFVCCVGVQLAEKQKSIIELTEASLEGIVHIISLMVSFCTIFCMFMHVYKCMCVCVCVCDWTCALGGRKNYLLFVFSVCSSIFFDEPFILSLLFESHTLYISSSGESTVAVISLQLDSIWIWHSTYCHCLCLFLLLMVFCSVPLYTPKRKIAHDFRLGTNKVRKQSNFLTCFSQYVLNGFCIYLVFRTCLNLKNLNIFCNVSLSR